MAGKWYNHNKMSDEELNNIDKLNQKLYQKTGFDGKTTRSGLSDYSQKVKTDWGRTNTDFLVNKADHFLNNSLLIKVLVGAIIFFILTLLGAGYVIFSKGNIISSDNVNLQVKSPGLIKAGEPARLQFSISNTNKVSLEEAELLVEFPDGTKSPLSLNEDLKRYREVVGEVGSGEVVNKSVQAVFFGQKDTQYEILVTLEYQIPGSNASYVKKETATIVIDSAPVSITVKSPDQISAGQTLVMSIEVASNSETVVDNLILKTEIPLGFKVIETSPALTGGDLFWNLGDLKKGDKKVIQIKGVVDGQNGEVKTFRFTAGQGDGSSAEDFNVVLNELIKTVALDRPFVNANTIVNGSSLPGVVIKAGQTVRVDVEWVNNLPVKADNVKIVALISGKTLDTSSIRAGQGFFDSNTNTITWDRTTLPALASLPPGEKDKTSFSFETNKLLGSGGSVLNPQVNLDLTVTAISAGNSAGKEIITKSSRVIKIESDYQLASQAVYTVGPFVNTGPMPPKVGTNTSYTISWSAINSSNNIEDGKVTAVLPNYVEWLGVTSPTDESVSFDPSTKIVTWNLAQVKAGTGILTQARSASFQISFLPSQSQIGQEVDLVNNVKLTGFDTFTETTITQEKGQLTTKLSTDPGFRLKDERVVE